jgi:hypothetical protein
MKNLEYKNMLLQVINMGAFEDGSPCIELHDQFEPYARISFCAHDGKNVFPASAGCIWLKDWSENKDLAEFLIQENYVEFTGKQIPQQFVVYKEFRITDKLKELIKE